MSGLTSRSRISKTRLLNDLPDLERAPALHGADQRHLVGVLEIAADRDAARDPCESADVGLEPLGQVHRRGLALEGRVGRQHDLFVRLAVALRCAARSSSSRTFSRSGPDAVHRRDGAVQHVVAAPERAGPLDGQHVERLLDDAQPRWSRAGSAQIGHSGPVGDVEADSQ